MSRRGRGRQHNPSYGSDAASFPLGGLGPSRGRGRAGGPGIVAQAPTPAQTQAAPPPAQTHPAPPPVQTHAPREPTPVEASSSSAPPPMEASLTADVEKKLTLRAPPPSSSKALAPPARPGFGTVGTRCQVRANHFLVEVAERDLHHYDVTISPVVTSKKINRDVMKQLVHFYKESQLGNRTPSYDGMKSIYTAGPLPFETKEFVVNLVDKDGPDGSSSSGPKRKDREFKVTINFANKPDLHQLQEFLRRRQRKSPQEVIQVLDVVLRATPSEKYTVVGRSFFSTDLGAKGELGEGLEYWRGFYQSLRPTQLGLSLNIDVSARSFYEPILVTEFVRKHFNYRDVSRPLSDRDRVKVKKALKGVKVSLDYRQKRTYRITGVSTDPLSQLRFTLEDQKTTSVVQYYRERYNIVLKNVALPALQSGSDSRPIYLPMELCTIVSGQRYSRKLNERQVTALLRATCQRPRDRENSIKEMVMKNNYSRDNLIKEQFGMQVREEMALVDARVLPPPQLKYHDTGRERIANPQMGQWNMVNKKMVNGGQVDFWAFVNFSCWLNPDFNSRFCADLVNMCNSKGMHFHSQPLIPSQSAHPGQIERVLKDIHKKSTKRLQEIGQPGKSLQLLIIILPDVTGSYGMIKRICETELGIVSQCCQPKQAAKLNNQYLENLALKINAKVGGRNTVLNDAIQKKIPLVTDVPTIIFGADVTHPPPGEDSSPSIAAVVASMDWPEVTKFRALVSAQAHRQEIIQDLYCFEQGNHAGMIRDHLRAFYRSTNRRPERIIFYRDGVSEGQFSQVLLYEMDAIRKACLSLQEGYVPPVTFVVVQKRHHTRLFPSDHNNRQQTDKSGNIKPGTVIDTKICHPTEFDFYLNSHAGIQGTSRPAHYHVLFDENRFSADALQMLTNNLCYTYVRCTRSVSIVPPAYYAHLVAFRARHYIEGDASDAGSTTGSTAGSSGVQFRALPAINENVKDVMFYC